MHIHILGICGTFMGGIALLAREKGFRVTGSDANVYPPMSTQLEQAGIELSEGYEPGVLDPAPDYVVVGNAMSRGNPCVEYMLDRGLRYISGPQWLSEHILQDRWVLAVAGTHGKTSTSSLLAWILEYAGLKPGFLIGGVPGNFGLSARSGDAPFFVVEADEYDTAFFDKRSKFVHYHPRTLILNNLEFDHADIFDDLAAIQRQFHHLLRTVPGNGLIVMPDSAPALNSVIEQGCWTPIEQTHIGDPNNSGWSARSTTADDTEFDLYLDAEPLGSTHWTQIGKHNLYNAMAAIAAARHAGVPVTVSLEALGGYKGVKRRMELRGEINQIRVYDDFAHHPTAIQTTLEGLRGQVGSARIIAVMEPRSNTMRMGVHKDTLVPALASADVSLIMQPQDQEAGVTLSNSSTSDVMLFETVDSIIAWLVGNAKSGDHVLIMSNGGFENIHTRLLEALK